ncbi:MAG: hypothetical protein R3Y40_02340 [Eubacteriales bacterium]
MSTEMDLLFGVLGLACGIYCLYSAFMMSRTGIVSTTLILDKETAKKKCTNIGEFLVEVIPPTIGLGIATMFYGVVILIDTYVVECYWVSLFSIVLSVAALVWFAIVTSKSKKKYY